MIIVFFTGLIIMVSGSPLGDVSNITYLNLICNVVGGILMGTSAYFLFENEKKKKNELKLLIENLAGKEEYENEIGVLKTIEKILQEHGKLVREIEEKIIKQIKCVEHLTEKLSVGFQELLNAIGSVDKSIDDGNMKMSNAIDILHKEYTELEKQEQTAFSKVIDNTTNVLEKFQTHARQLEKTDADIVESLKSIDQRIITIDILPREISESVEMLISKFGTTVDSIQNDYKNLTEDLEDQERNRTKKFNSIMSEIRDASEKSNKEMAEEIRKLSDQYVAFEKMISTIVDQMSHMAEEDIRVMKGFLNG